MLLSSSYAHDVNEPDLELKCTAYNIGNGNNRKLLEKCPVLSEYMIFVDKVRKFMDEYNDIETAIDIAIKECIAEHVLEDFLSEKGNEVKQVAAMDYTFERREKLFRAEEREEGIKEGIKVGIKEGVQQGKALILVKQICTKLQKSQSVEQIADAPNYDMEAIAKRCMHEIHLSTCR